MSMRITVVIQISNDVAERPKYARFSFPSRNHCGGLVLDCDRSVRARLAKGDDNGFPTLGDVIVPAFDDLIAIPTGIFSSRDFINLSSFCWIFISEDQHKGSSKLGEPPDISI